MRFADVIARALTVLLAVHGLSHASAEDARSRSPVVVGYLPHYRIPNWSADRLVPVSDLIFFGIKPAADGGLITVNLNAESLKKIQRTKTVSNCRLLICVGGWQRSQAFAEVSADRDKRRSFIDELLSLCLDKGFDGVDFDWEHPHGQDQLRSYAQLLSEASKSLHTRKLLVTVAQASWQDLGKEVYATVDRVHLMSYDHTFPQATLGKSKADVERILGQGCPARKLALGLPFYGRNKHGEAKSYADLAHNRTIPSATDEIDGYAFNGKATIAQKVRLAMHYKLAGIMIWELGQDSSDAHESLLRPIRMESRKQIDIGD